MKRWPACCCLSLACAAVCRAPDPEKFSRNAEQALEQILGLLPQPAGEVVACRQPT